MHNADDGYVEIRCQEMKCPHGMKNKDRCKFGEVCMKGRTEPVSERHKCKRGPEEIIITIIPKIEVA